MDRNQQALGMIETLGYVAAVEAADAACKAANVSLLGIERSAGGIVTVKLLGDVSATKAATDAGAAAAQRIGTLLAVHVIARPDALLAPLLPIQSYQPAWLSAAPSSGRSTAASSPRARPGSRPAGRAARKPAAARPGVRGSRAASSAAGDLASLSVAELRRRVRELPGAALRGREVSRANKPELLKLLGAARG